MRYWVRLALAGALVMVAACGAQGTHARVVQTGPATDPARLAGAEYSLSIKAYRDKNWPVALVHIQRALALAPDNQDYRYWKGIILYQQADYPAALSTLDALPLSYAWYPARWYQTESALRTARTNEALALIERVLALPDDAAKNQRHIYDLLWRTLGRLAPGDPRRMQTTLRHEANWLARVPFQAPEHDASMYWLARIRLDEAVRLARLGTGAGQGVDDNFTRGLALRSRAGRYTKDLDPTLVARALLEQRQFAKAIDLVSKIPSSEHPSARGWTLTAAWLGLGRTNEAARAVEESLTRPIQAGWQAALYTSWIQTQTALVRINAEKPAAPAGELDGLEAGALQAAAVLASREREIFDWCRNTSWEHAPWARYVIAWAWARAAEVALVRGDAGAAARWYGRAEGLVAQGIGQYEANLNRTTLAHYRRAAEFWQTRRERIKADTVRYRMLAWVFAGQEDGHPVTPGRQAALARFLSRGLAQLSAFFFYASNGRLLVEYEVFIRPEGIPAYRNGVWQPVERDATGKPFASVNYVEPDMDSLGPLKNELFSPANRDRDAFVFLYPGTSSEPSSEKLAGATAGFFHPFGNGPTGGGKRARINARFAMAGVMASGMIHEMFHHIEDLYRDRFSFVKHVYKQDYRHLWPAWYRGTGEIDYYYEIFRRILNPAGFGPMLMRER